MRDEVAKSCGESWDRFTRLRKSLRLLQWNLLYDGPVLGLLDTRVLRVNRQVKQEAFQTLLRIYRVHITPPDPALPTPKEGIIVMDSYNKSIITQARSLSIELNIRLVPALLRALKARDCTKLQEVKLDLQSSSYASWKDPFYERAFSRILDLLRGVPVVGLRKDGLPMKVEVVRKWEVSRRDRCVATS